jgi:hypothetical protein
MDPCWPRIKLQADALARLLPRKAFVRRSIYFFPPPIAPHLAVAAHQAPGSNDPLSADFAAARRTGAYCKKSAVHQPATTEESAVKCRNLVRRVMRDVDGARATLKELAPV